MPRTYPPWQVKRDTLVKSEENTDAKYGCKPEERPIKDYIRLGIINLDKTAGPSSHEVTAWVKRILSLANAGHGGTLEASLLQAREIPA
jgi:H/ACA ribonucleoprotein complex subunit 4